METKLILYNNEFCGECRVVREKLAELRLSYLCVNVSPIKADRQDVYKLTGQYLVPVFVDGDKVFNASDNILEYLCEAYGSKSLRPIST